jgi:hypothetical protein
MNVLLVRIRKRLSGGDQKDPFNIALVGPGGE